MMRTKKLSRVRGQVPRKARIYPEMTPRQAAFLELLRNIGYEDDDILFRPTDMRILLKNDNHAVCRVYIPTFFVVPERTLYDIDGRLTSDQEDKLISICKRDGYSLRIVTEADLPIGEYLEIEEVSSHES